jgi:hypothetical protein
MPTPRQNRPEHAAALPYIAGRAKRKLRCPSQSINAGGLHDHEHAPRTVADILNRDFRNAANKK